MGVILDGVVKIYEKHWTQANGDALVWANALDKTSDATYITACFAVNFPHECMIKKIMVAVAEGSIGAGPMPHLLATIYNLPPCDFTPEEARGAATGVNQSASIYMNSDYILGKCSDEIASKSSLLVNGHESIQWFAPTNDAGGLGANTHDAAIYFRNMEGTQTNPKRRLYVAVQARTPSSDLVLEMAIGGEPGIGQ